MSDVTIWHNPGCGSSKNALQYLSDKGIAPIVYQYLKERPSRAQLEELLKQLKLPAASLLRPNEDQGEKLNLYRDDASEDEILEAMAAHPKLIQRPVVVTERGAVIARPKTRIDDVLEMQSAKG
jgi:arsenate reductase (glutaredoxin)